MERSDMDRSECDVPGGFSRKGESKWLPLGFRYLVSGRPLTSQGELRRMAHNILKSDATIKKSLPMKQMRAMADDDYRNTLLSLAG